ncbi:chondroitin sulfate synthase 2 [Hyalella azteca]|uniref:Hexosyltransferase n=1 Tax=Hyalella azteca TaxID=294128 RepID=A0A8B7NJ35_HYAAZ|nr:chondroitin sulfate synthase 2 [Hyalella azteca]
MHVGIGAGRCPQFKMFSAHHERIIAFLRGKHGIPLILGIIVGLTVSLAALPIWDHICNVMVEDLGYQFFTNDLEQSAFELRMVKRDPDEIANKMMDAKQVVRPRYFSSELNIKAKLVVAIATTLSVVKQYGYTWNLTIHEHVDHLVFFVGEDNPPASMGLPIISFPDVKNEQLMYSIVSYLQDHYSSSYDFFMLISAMHLDSVPYINGLALHRTLGSISTSRPLHYGVPAATGALYCKLGYGIILSSAVVSSMAASSEWCRAHAIHASSDDATFGRCIMHATALPCTMQIQEKPYHSVALNLPHTKQAQTLVLGQLRAAVERLEAHASTAVVPYSVTGLSQPHHLLTVHQFFLTGEVVIAKSALAAARVIINEMREKAPLTQPEITWPLGSHPPHQPATRYDVLPWVMFNASHVLLPDQSRNSAPLSGALLEDITSVVLAGSSHISNRSDGRLLLKRLEYGHYRVDPVRGTDYILSLTFRDGASGSLVTKIVEASRGIVDTEFIPMPFVNENTKLTMVVPVTPQLVEQTLLFIASFKKNKSVWPNCSLLLVLMQPSSRERRSAFEAVLKAVDETSTSDGLLKAVTVVTPAASSHMTELVIMDQLVRKVASKTLVFLVPPAATFTAEVLNRVRMNTIQGWQFFSPVMYGLYHPNVVEDATASAYTSREIKSTLGHYLRYDYSAISFYMSDYIAARKLSSKLFPIFGSQRSATDRSSQRGSYHISLYRLMISFSSCHALRAPEPFLRMPYDERSSCCVASKLDTNAPSAFDGARAARKSNTGDHNSGDAVMVVSDGNVAPAVPANRLLSDVSLLLGDCREENDAAFYHYVSGNLLFQLQPSYTNNSLKDFRGDGFCYEKCLDSFGTRVQLSKLLMEYDEKYGSLSN